MWLLDIQIMKLWELFGKIILEMDLHYKNSDIISEILSLTKNIVLCISRKPAFSPTT